MKQICIIISFFIIAASIFGSYRSIVLASTQPERTNIQNGDLCRGTGGNGKIVNVRNSSFTLERNDGRNLIVNLTEDATIETPTGPVTLSDLKIGDRVTLVGDDNRNGSFTANTIVACNDTPEYETRQTTPHNVKRGNTASKNISSMINASITVISGLIWFCLATFLRIKKKKSFVYLFFFTIFYIYLYNVLDYTLLQFQSLLILQHFVPNLMLNGVDTGKNVNLIPLFTLTLDDVKTSLLNILMMLPFGFGLLFITHLRFKKLVIVGLSFSLLIELLQLVTGFMANTTFRIADINDLIFNTLGVALGYVFFVGFVRIFHHVFRKSKILKNPILRYIAERPQLNIHVDNQS